MHVLLFSVVIWWMLFQHGAPIQLCLYPVVETISFMFKYIKLRIISILKAGRQTCKQLSFLSSFCVKCLCPFLVHSFSREDASLCSPIFSCVGCSIEGPAGQNTKDCSTSATSLMDFQGIKPRDLEFVISFYPRRDAFLQPISSKDVENLVMELCYLNYT